jgi:hypothetical protein
MTSIRTIAAAALIALAVSGATAAATPSHDGAVSVANSPRVCRSAATWGPAPDRYRPCARIVAVEEDGSIRLEVSDADGTVRYTTGVGALDR